MLQNKDCDIASRTLTGKKATWSIAGELLDIYPAVFCELEDCYLSWSLSLKAYEENCLLAESSKQKQLALENLHCKSSFSLIWERTGSELSLLVERFLISLKTIVDGNHKGLYEGLIICFHMKIKPWRAVRTQFARQGVFFVELRHDNITTLSTVLSQVSLLTAEQFQWKLPDPKGRWD